MSNSNPPAAPVTTQSSAPPTAQSTAQAAAEPNPLVRNYQELLALLTRDSVTHEPRVAAEEVIIPTQMGELASAQVICWRAADGALQFIQPLPLEVPVEHLPAMESALNRLNFGLAFAGYSLSHENRRVLYRLTLPLFVRGGLLPGEIKAYFSIAVKNAADALPVLKRIANGTLPADRVIPELQRYMGKAGQGPTTPNSTYED